MIELNGTKYENPLFVFAMESEAAQQFEDVETLFTSLGKVNAAYELTKKIAQTRPDIVINLGTAGSNQFGKGETVCCTGFVQRDMDVGELGFEKYKTPFSPEEPILAYGLKINSLSEGICGTGDSFETGHAETVYSVVDMEAYALALICKREQIPFLCVKYISDGADDNAATDWTEQVKLAAEALRKAVLS